jgi:hypothetical protein
LPALHTGPLYLLLAIAAIVLIAAHYYLVR